MKDKKYEERAIKLLEKLERPKEQKQMKRPYFIEITGSPSSGKTTIIQILDPFFRRQGFRVYTPQEGAEVIRHIPRTNHLYNVRTGLYALTTLIDASVNNNYDLVIFDRCLYDALTWINYWSAKNDLTITETKTLEGFFSFYTWLNWLDAIFFVVADPEEAAKRDREASLTDKFGTTTNPENLKKLMELFTKVYRWCRKNNYDNKNGETIFLINTTGMDRKEMAKDILEKTLSSLEKRKK